MQSRQQQQQQQQQQVQQPSMLPELNLSLLQSQQSWTPLETLAEVSRQINHLNEHGEDGEQGQNATSSTEPMTGIVASATPGTSNGNDPFQLQEQFTVQSPQSVQKDQAREKQGQSVAPSGYDGLSGTADFTIQDLMPLTVALKSERRSSHDHTAQVAQNTSGAPPNLTVAAAAAAAAAATARLSSTSMIDSALFASLGANIGGNLGEELARAIGSVEPGQHEDATSVPPSQTPTPAADVPITEDSSHSRDNQPAAQMTPSASFAKAVPVEGTLLTPIPHSHTPASASQTSTRTSATPSRGAQLPWGEFTYMTNASTPSAPAPITPMTGLPIKSVFRLEHNGSRSRHARARFEETRRKEVQQIRMIGACVRCRILRKTCSKGDPCDTCRKVLAPRLWRSGCIRIKFTDELDLYNAGVQIAHCQKMVNRYKATMDFDHASVTLDATHSISGIGIAVDALRGSKLSELVDPSVNEEYQATVNVIMIDEMDVLPDKMQTYVRAVLPEFIRKEEAEFSRITLTTAYELTCRTEDEKIILQTALELWGYVEVIERELKWNLSIRPSPIARTAGKEITKETDDDLYKTMCLQLTAAAERRAMITSKELLRKMQQMLQHGRTAIGHPVFFAILVLLITLEKSTWAFKSWEEVEALRDCWPLDNAPSYYTSQGLRMAEIFRMLLVIRKSLPKIVIREDGVLVLDDTDPIYASYLERVNLKCTCPLLPFLPTSSIVMLTFSLASHVIKQMQDPAIDYASSRTLELHFCAHILLPDEELQAHAPASVPLPALATTSATFEPLPERRVSASASAPPTPDVVSHLGPGAHFTT